MSRGILKAMRSVEPIESSRLSKFDRLITNGVAVYPNMYYRDVNDTSEEVRLSTKKCLKESKEWRPILNQIRYLVPYDAEIGRRFCVYGWHEEKLVGRIVFTEILNQPDGYGKDDFNSAKFVFPEYSGTYASRAFNGDWIYALFMSKVANNLYHYGKVREGAEGEFILKQLDPSWPCVSKIYRSDSAEFIPYILDKKRVQRDGQEFVLIEMNGDIFRNMDIYKYLRIDKRPKEVVYKTKEEMDNLTEEVRRTLCLT